MASILASILDCLFVAKTLKILNMGLWASKMGPRAPKVTKNRDFDLPKLLKIMIFTSQKIIKNRNFDLPTLSAIMILMSENPENATAKL